MNSWQTIKNHCVKGFVPGTVGFLNDVNKANDLYMDMRPHLRDRKASDLDFNKDWDVSTALIHRRQLERLGAI